MLTEREADISDYLRKMHKEEPERFNEWMTSKEIICNRQSPFHCFDCRLAFTKGIKR